VLSGTLRFKCTVRLVCLPTRKQVRSFNTIFLFDLRLVLILIPFVTAQVMIAIKEGDKGKLRKPFKTEIAKKDSNPFWMEAFQVYV